MAVTYPDITILDFPNVDDKEVLYWTHRTSELRTPLLKLFEKLFTYYDNNKISIAVLSAIIRRQLEIADSFLLLVSKGRIRDSGVLILNTYELTLDLQYISINTSYSLTWISHHKESKKPWKVDDQIKAIFPKQSEYDAEKKLYRSYSMIKHGNIAGKYVAFDIFIQDDKLALSFTEPSFITPNLYTMGFLLNRTFKASIKILKDIGIIETEIETEMKELYDKFYQNITTLIQLKAVEVTHPNNPEKQKESVEKLNLSFD